MSGDLYWGSVALALHCDDVGLTDVKGNAMTLTGVARSSTQSKFGGFSAHFGGTSDELHNTSYMGALDATTYSLQFWCYPSAQVQANPCVISVQNLKIEYKPAGYTDGFVINAGGVRTACGTFAQGTWHYVWIVQHATTADVYINGIFIATVPSVSSATGLMYVGSNVIGTNPDSAFTGYVDDVLFTSAIERTDYSVPIAAFPNNLPDPSGVVLGGPAFSGTAVGVVAPVADGLGTMAITGDVECLVYNTGFAGGALSLTGLASGVVGRTGAALGTVLFKGSGVASMGRFGPASGFLKFLGAAVGEHGVKGPAAGAMRMSGQGVGSTPIHPFGSVSGNLVVTGHAYGLGAPEPADVC